MTKIVLIGAGRLGSNLGKQLLASSAQLIQVFSRNLEHAKHVFPENAINQLASIDRYADLYIIATPDDSILAVAQEIQVFIPTNAMVVHVSGSISSDIFKGIFNHYGSFYPLQSFSKGKHITFENIPICCIANNRKNEKKLEELANKISNNVHIISDNDRATIHVSAVFVNNFTNVLFQIGSEIMNEKNLPFNLLMPLIEETVAKIKVNNPSEMQTGPAIRGDIKTIKKHLDLLENDSEYKEIYKLLSLKINSNLKI